MRFFILLFVYVAIAAKSSGQTAQPKLFIVPANKAYAEPFKEQQKGVHIPVGYVESRGEVSRWSDKETSVSWVVYQKKAVYNLSFAAQINAGKNLKFKLISSAASWAYEMSPFCTDLTFNGTGNTDTLFATTVHIPVDGYYKYTLTPLSDPASAISISSLLFNSKSETAHVNFIEYQSTPSVHISFSTTTPDIKPSYSWLYEEVLVPAGMDPLHTFYMAIGFYRGYLGIQTNSQQERRVLFSVWDSKDAEKDTAIRKDDLVTLVDKDETTTVNNFGGEGTGGQSYVKGANWKTNKPVQFLMNVLPQSDKAVLLSAWYNVNKEGWKYIATWRAPKEQRYFNGFHSFLENFGYTNGQLRREAYYYNAWGFNTEKSKWINFNKVRFSNTDGRVGQRVDYEQGVSNTYPDRFYMSAGGYTPTLQTGKEIELENKFPGPDLKLFETRVKQALANEGKFKIKSAVE